MKRNALLLIAALLLIVSLCFGASAAAFHLDDSAMLLDDTQATQLEQQLTELSSRHGLDIVVVTTDSTNGFSPMEYADDYYDYNGFGPDGVLLLVSMEVGDWWISTAGYGITAFTDAGIEYIGDQVVPYLSDGDYYTAFTTYARLCDSLIAQAKAGDPFDSDDLPKDPFNPGFSLILALVIGLVAALIVTGSMKGQLKTVRQQVKADSYVAAGSLQLTQSKDLFLFTQTTRQEKPQDSSGSTTHTSSSGTTHGGGGGKF